MVHVLKVYLMEEEGKGIVEIRRIAVGSDYVEKFDLLMDKIRDLFPVLRTKAFNLKWTDQDGDFITMSSNAELDQALANVDDGLIKLYASPIKDEMPNCAKEKAATEEKGVPHPNVVCDGCNTKLFGIRYKCLECQDFDLCSACNAANKHPDHDMIKLVKPVSVSRTWVFMGARKIWRSMFGRCPRNFHFHGSEESSSNEATPPPVFKIIDDVIGSTFASVADTLMSQGAWFEKSGNFKATPAEKPCPDKESKSSTPCREKESEVPASKMEAEKPSEQEANVGAAAACEEQNKENITEAVVMDNADKKETVAESSVKFSTCGTFALKESSPVSASIGMETSNAGDDWTLLNNEETSHQSSTSEQTAESVTESRADSTTAPKTVEDNSAGDVPKDPRIASALSKMYAMGFTNEGGWLEKLLVTKKGNINDALDALYPNTQRN